MVAAAASVVAAAAVAVVADRWVGPEASFLKHPWIISVSVIDALWLNGYRAIGFQVAGRCKQSVFETVGTHITFGRIVDIYRVFIITRIRIGRKTSFFRRPY